MAITYVSSVVSNRLQQVINAIDGGPGNGLIQLGTAGMALVLSTITLNKPSATISGRILTFAGLPLLDPNAANSGTAVTAQVTNSTGAIVGSGLTVGTSGSGSDIIINQVNLTAGQIVTFTAGTITGN